MERSRRRSNGLGTFRALRASSYVQRGDTRGDPRGVEKKWTSVTLSWPVLLVAGAALRVRLGAYRQSRGVIWRVVGIGAVASGAATLLVLMLTLPVFQTSDGEAPEPTIVAVLAETALELEAPGAPAGHQQALSRDAAQ